MSYNLDILFRVRICIFGGRVINAVVICRGSF